MPQIGRENARAKLQQTIVSLKDALTSLQEAHQATVSNAEQLEQQNHILRKNFDAIRDDLINAAGLSLGRMIIEAGLAVKELRENMPAEPTIHEKDLEEGELIDSAASLWKSRLDKMILRISEAHTKAKEETQEVADKMSDMAKEMQRSQEAIDELNPPLRRFKRLRGVLDVDYEGEDEIDEDDDPDYDIEKKRARYGDGTFRCESAGLYPILAPAEPISASNIPIQPFKSDEDGVLTKSLEHFPPPLQQDQNPFSTCVLEAAATERVPLGEIEPNGNGGNMGMHVDRQRWLQSVKIEEDVEIHSTVENTTQVKTTKKWRGPFSLLSINQEEADWLERLKSSWTQGGWTNKLEWLRAVRGEYRRIKATARFPEEAESNLRVLESRIRKGEFLLCIFRI